MVITIFLCTPSELDICKQTFCAPVKGGGGFRGGGFPITTPGSAHTITFGSHQNSGGCNHTRRVSHYLADLVPMTEVCLVTYTENLSNVWKTADYPLHHLVSHIWHEGVPSIFPGNGGPYHTHEKRTYHMSCIFLAAARGWI